MSIRLRLALWYTAVLGLTLIVFSILLYFLMARHLVLISDDSVVSRAHHIVSTVRVIDSSTPDAQQLELPPIDAFESEGIYVQVVQEAGGIVAQSSNLDGRSISVDAQVLDAARNGEASYADASIGGDLVRVYVHPLTVDSHIVGFVEVGQSYAEVYGTLDSLRLMLMIGGVVSLLFAGGIGWAVAGGALRPIAMITNTARDIALSRGFSRRLEGVETQDEVGQLGRTFNEMLASLDDAYSTQQRFIADASHELRAPLTAVRANLELLLRQADNLPAQDRKELLTAASTEAERMAALVSDLLSLARADAGQQLEMRPVELDRLLMEVFSQSRLLAKETRLVVDDLDQVQLLGDVDRLKQVLLILIDNALKYTPNGGRIGLSLRQDGESAVLAVADSGIGIADEDLPHIFERFYRADKARAREAAGTGLGLAIAKWIVEQHGGTLRVESVPGQGSTFSVVLPLSENRRPS